MTSVLTFLIRPLGWLLRPVRSGDRYLTCNLDAVKSAPQCIQISSPAFDHAGNIPQKHTGWGEDVSPPIHWKGVPAGTKELVFILEDPDIPVMWRPAVHMLATKIKPTTEGFPEGGLQADKHNASLLMLQKGSMGSYGWHGPQPPPGHGPHTYVFQLIALNSELDLPDTPVAYTEVVKELTKERVLGWGRLDGKFEAP